MAGFASQEALAARLGYDRSGFIPEERNPGSAATPDKSGKRQDEQAQGHGGQMGGFIQWPAAQQVELNPAVGCVESQRDPGQQNRIGPPPDRTRTS